MEQLIRILIEVLVRKGMEITSIPAFIKNVANSIAANPSLSFEDLNDQFALVGVRQFRSKYLYFLPYYGDFQIGFCREANPFP